MFAHRIKKKKSKTKKEVHTEKNKNKITHTPHTSSLMECSTISGSARPRILFDGELLGGKLFEIV